MTGDASGTMHSEGLAHCVCQGPVFVGNNVRGLARGARTAMQKGARAFEDRAGVDCQVGTEMPSEGGVSWHGGCWWSVLSRTGFLGLEAATGDTIGGEGWGA